MSTHSLFENFTNDKSINDIQYGEVRLHTDNQLIKRVFKANDLVVIKHQEKKTLGVIKFESDIANFNRNSIHLNRYQRIDLTLPENERIIHLEIKKGNLLHAIIYFIEGFGRLSQG